MVKYQSDMKRKIFIMLAIIYPPHKIRGYILMIYVLFKVPSAF